MRRPQARHCGAVPQKQMKSREECNIICAMKLCQIMLIGRGIAKSCAVKKAKENKIGTISQEFVLQ